MPKHKKQTNITIPQAKYYLIDYNYHYDKMNPQNKDISIFDSLRLHSKKQNNFKDVIINDKTPLNMLENIIVWSFLIQFPLGMIGSLSLFFQLMFTSQYKLSICFQILQMTLSIYPYEPQYEQKSQEYFMFQSFMKFFNVHCVVTEDCLASFENEAGNSTLTLLGPHGSVPISGLFGYSLFSNNVKFRLKLAGIKLNLYIPILNQFLTKAGYCSVDKSTLQKEMKSGTNICMNPGGLKEASLSNGKKYGYQMKNRQGHIKLAKENKVSMQIGMITGNSEGFDFINNKFTQSVESLTRSLFRVGFLWVQGYMGLPIFRQTQCTGILDVGVKRAEQEDKSIEEIKDLYILRLKDIFMQFRDVIGQDYTIDVY